MRLFEREYFRIGLGQLLFNARMPEVRCGSVGSVKLAAWSLDVCDLLFCGLRNWQRSWRPRGAASVCCRRPARRHPSWRPRGAASVFCRRPARRHPSRRHTCRFARRRRRTRSSRRRVGKGHPAQRAHFNLKLTAQGLNGLFRQSQQSVSTSARRERRYGGRNIKRKRFIADGV